ncbi:MAG: TIM barrel protein [Clostridiaceae bacterium]|jgi:endonuclease IV|nr:TIM barrel protein [Clostridiaceae bacterium]
MTNKKEIFFGPSGNSQSFYGEGNTATLQAPAWVSARGLNAFEYSFGRGINIHTAGAREIGAEMRRYGIELSVHAPYFINFASDDPEKVEKSVVYILQSLRLLGAFKGLDVGADASDKEGTDGDNTSGANADGNKTNGVGVSVPGGCGELKTTSPLTASSITEVENEPALSGRPGRVIFHAGSDGKMLRKESFARALDGLRMLLSVKNDSPYKSYLLCPEAMGKSAQVGSVDEVIEMCRLDALMYPCFDFGHINSITQGGLKTKDDFKRVIDKTAAGLDDARVRNMHIHFSKIQYGAKGEIRHLTFADDIYGPEFLPLAEVIAEYRLTPVIISESDGTQAEDAAAMKRIYESVVGKIGK